MLLKREEKKVRHLLRLTNHYNDFKLVLTNFQAWKKIEDTKKKAKDIMQVKQRNEETQKMKEYRQREKEQQERLLLERNMNMRQQIKEQ